MPEKRDVIKQRFASNEHQARLKGIAEPFAALADAVITRDPEETVNGTVLCLRALKTAQDAAVAAAIELANPRT